MLDPRIVGLLLFAALVVSVAGGSLVRYGKQQHQWGWVVGGWAIIVIWVGSIAFVLVRYAVEVY